MTVNRYVLAALVLISVIGSTSAQQPGLLPQQPVIVLDKTVEQMPAPQSVGAPAPCTQKICVSEPKKNTKTVYTSRCKEYCQPNCSLWSMLFGGGDCGCDGNCGDVKTKKVLVKKTVPDCDTTQCVLKEVPVVPCAPCVPCTPSPR